MPERMGAWDSSTKRDRVRFRINPPAGDVPSKTSFTGGERRHCLNLPGLDRRREWISSRLAMKALAVACLGGTHLDFTAHPGENGRPELFMNGRPCGHRISLSHCNGWGMAAFARRDVGADLEKLDAKDAQIRRLIGRDSEWDLFSTHLGHERDDHETILFSLKEAVLKCHGQTIAIPREQIEVLSLLPGSGQDSRVEFQARGPGAEQVAHGAFHRMNDFIVSLALA